MNDFLINHDGMTIKAPANSTVSELEAFLNSSGYTLGRFHAPVGTDTALTIAGWLKDPLVPPMYYEGALPELVVSIDASGPLGGLITNPAPRSATGPDINYLVVGVRDLAEVRSVLLRIKVRAGTLVEQAYSFSALEPAITALAALAHGKSCFEWAYLVADGPGDVVVTVGHDTASELGRARKAHVERLVSSCGGSPADGVRAAPDSGRSIELWAPYNAARALQGSCEVLFEGGAGPCRVYRYGKEGVSIAFGAVVAEKVKEDAHRVVAASGGFIVQGGGAFGVNGNPAALDRIFGSLVKKA